MRLILSALIFLSLQLSARAAALPFGQKPIELSCITEIPSTSFVVWTEGEELVARVIHHNGAEYAPAFVGTYTPHDLPLLQARGEAIRKMGHDVRFRWPLAKCRRLGEIGLFCTGSTDEQPGEGGVKLRPWAIATKTVVEEGIAGRFESTSVSLSLDIGGTRDLSVEMSYPKGSCLPHRLF